MAHPDIRLCDLTSGTFTHTLKGNRDMVLDVQWSPNNEYQLISGCKDGTLKLFDIRQSGLNSCIVSFDRTNNRLSKTSSTPQSSSQTIRAHLGPINGIQYTNDGSKIVSLMLFIN